LSTFLMNRFTFNRPEFHLVRGLNGRLNCDKLLVVVAKWFTNMSWWVRSYLPSFKLWTLFCNDLRTVLKD